LFDLPLKHFIFFLSDHHLQIPISDLINTIILLPGHSKMEQPESIPSGPPMKIQETEFLETPSVPQGLSSATSDDSFISQIPLPYHLGRGSHNPSNLTSPPPPGPQGSTTYPEFATYEHQHMYQMPPGHQVYPVNEQTQYVHQIQQGEQLMIHDDFSQYGQQQMQGLTHGQFGLPSGPTIDYQGVYYPPQMGQYQHAGYQYSSPPQMHSHFEPYMQNPTMMYSQQVFYGDAPNPDSQYGQTPGMESFNMYGPSYGPPSYMNQYGYPQDQGIYQSRAEGSVNTLHYRGNGGPSNRARTSFGYANQHIRQSYGGHNGSNGHQNNGYNRFRGRPHFNGRARGPNGYRLNINRGPPPQPTLSVASSSDDSDNTDEVIDAGSRPTSANSERSATSGTCEEQDLNQTPSATLTDISFLGESTIITLIPILNSRDGQSEVENLTPIKPQLEPFPDFNDDYGEEIEKDEEDDEDEEDEVDEDEEENNSSAQNLHSDEGRSVVGLDLSARDSTEDISGNVTPINLDSITIDPVLGPPPVFWPAGMEPPISPAKSARSASPVMGSQGNSSTARDNKFVHQRSVSSDPFTGYGHGRSISVPLPIISHHNSILHSPQPRNPLATSGLLDQVGNSKTVLAPASIKPPVTAAAATATSNPINALMLANQNPGVSRHLSTLTDGGKIKPSIEDAFDPYNMPFVEPARVYSKPSTSGLIRISNVGFILSSYNLKFSLSLLICPFVF